eukprot:scaffold238072_cov15-Tisochrysis_lutea.AAC.2
MRQCKGTKRNRTSTASFTTWACFTAFSAIQTSEIQAGLNVPLLRRCSIISKHFQEQQTFKHPSSPPPNQKT